MTSTHSFITRFKFSGSARLAEARNRALMAVMLLLLLVFIAGISISIQLLEVNRFSHKVYQAKAINQISILLAERRGVQALSKAETGLGGVNQNIRQLDLMLVYSMKPLLDSESHIEGVAYSLLNTLRSCLVEECMHSDQLSSEDAFLRHSSYIQQLLSTSQSFLSHNGIHFSENKHLSKVITLIIQSAQFAEATGTVRGRMSSRLANGNLLSSEQFDSALFNLRQQASSFSEQAPKEIINELDLHEYLSRIDDHFERLDRQISYLSESMVDMSAKDFFQLSTLFINDLVFFQSQLHQHLMDHNNHLADYYSTWLIQLGIAAFLIMVALILLLISRFRGDKKKAERKNLELGFLKKALDQHAIVSMTDAKGDITYINKKFTRISGFEPDDLLGKNHRIINSGIHKPEFFKKLWDSVHRGKPWSGEVCNRKKDGSLYWVYATVLPMHDAAGKLIAIISVRTDITRQKETELLLKNEKHAADLANQAKSDFLANMSHEIRTPMNAVIGLTHLALKSSHDPKTQDYLRKIQLSANNLLDIINDILDFSKIEAGKISMENIVFSPVDVIRHVVDLSRVKAGEKNLPVQLVLGDNPAPFCMGDPLRISQILLNLLNNAIKFTNEGHVALEVSQTLTPDQKAVFTFNVRDTGIGISSEKLDVLFDAFSQEDASTTRLYGGTGLGLSISKKLAEMMGSQLVVESIQGEGSCFSFTLELSLAAPIPERAAPAIPERAVPIYGDKARQGKFVSCQAGAGQEVVDPAKGEECAVKPEVLSTDTGQKLGARVLIAEDNLINQEVITGLLEPYGLELIVTENGQEAVEAVKHQHFDLVLMDIQMPVMDGLTATHEICALGLTQPPPIIAMTANAMASDREKCFEAGMADFISKPIDPAKLDALLSHWLATQRVAFPSQVEGVGATKLPPCHIEGVDMTTAYISANRNPELLQRLFSAFVDEFKSMQFTVDEMDVLARELHTLKGLSATLGMSELHSITRGLEDELKQSGLLRAEQLERAQTEVNRLVVAICRCMASYSADAESFSDLVQSYSDLVQSYNVDTGKMADRGSPHREGQESCLLESQVEPPSDEVVAAIKSQLEAELMQGDAEAQTSALNLMIALQQTRYASKAADVLELTDRYDFEHALDILKTIALDAHSE